MATRLRSTPSRFLSKTKDGDLVYVRLQPNIYYRCASGCVVECRICNRKVAGSNLSLGYFAPRSTQPSIPPGSVNEYQLRLGRQRQMYGSGGKTVKSLENTCHIPERFCGGDSLRRGAISSVCTFTFLLLQQSSRKSCKLLQAHKRPIGHSCVLLFR